MKVTNLRTNHFENPIGYQISPLSLSWKVENAKGKKTQMAQVKIFQDQQLMELAWDSTKRADINSASCLPDFVPNERTRYYWQVQVWDDAGDYGISEVAFFETAPEKIKGKWITAPFEKEAHSVYQKIWKLPSAEDQVKNARLYISGMGLYEAYLNGKKVGDEYLTPFYNDYNHWIQFQSYDVTDMLKAGENTLGIMLGNGWYKGRFGFIDKMDRLYGDTQAVICELEITLKNDKKVVISSDESFQCQKSPVLSSSIYDGEIFDANLTLQKAAWIPAVFAGESIQEWTGRLVPRFSLPLTFHEEIKPIRIIHTPAGETVLDFGQNLTGLFSFISKEPKGAKIHFQFGEILQGENFYNENLRTAKEEFTYISDGSEKKVRPHFTFYGFRYMKVEGVTDIEAADFRAYALYSHMEETGHIETSNPKVNRLFLNALWGQKGNFVDTPTDCPQRDERMGWTGDAQVFCATASFNMYTPAFYHKFLYDMAEEQKELDGAVPHVVPDILDQINYVLKDPDRAAQLGIKTSQESNGSGVAHADKTEDADEKTEANENAISDNAAGSCAWGDAATVIPWTSYVFFGDETLLKKEYENMKMWTDYIHRIDEEKCGGKRLWTYGFHFADWLALDNFHKDSCLGGTDPYYVASCYYLYSAELTAKAAAVLGKGEDAIYYTKLAKEVREAIRKEYFTLTGRIAIDTQTAMVLALRFGIVPEPARERLIQTLKTKLEEENIHLTTGFVGTPYLCPVLTENGLADYAYTLLLNEDFPSWLYEVNMGATTIWERWNSVLSDGSISDTGMNSLNHYSYGSIVEWMYRYMCGINPDEHNAGFRKFVIKPYPDKRFEYAAAKYQSVYGLIESDWKRMDTGWQFHVIVPFDTTAHFILEKRLREQFGKNISVRAEEAKAALKAEEELKHCGQTVLEPGSYVIKVEE